VSRSLLVILPHNPGDVVMALAALARLRAAYPDLALDYVIGEECRELAEGNPLLRRVYPLPRRALREAWAAGDASGVLSRLEGFLDGLNAVPYDFSLNLFQERYGALLQGLVNADRKAGLELVDGSRFRVGSRALEHLFAVPAARRDNGWHAVDAYIRAARELINGPGTAFGPTPAPAPAPASSGPLPWPRSSAGYLPPLSPPPGWDGPTPKSYLAFHPGSAWPGKRWPGSHWAALIEACARAGLTVVWTGSPEERDALERIRALLSPTARAAVHDWAGRTSLLGAAWIHAGARLSVSGDTVAMHLAAATGTPTLALFGPSSAVETGPYGPGHFVFTTEAETLADLAFDRDHAGLCALSPEIVAAFALEGRLPGVLPDGAALWETAWDPVRDRQVLRDARGRLHPHYPRSEALVDVLDRRPSPADPLRKPDLEPLPHRVFDPPPGSPEAAVAIALEACLSGPLDASSLRALDQADQTLAAATRSHLVWEAYRIALNGLPLADIRQHLELRRQRFRLALQEASASRRSGP
jgi:ADP-heptose:LPS heptosyltransferase